MSIYDEASDNKLLRLFYEWQRPDGRSKSEIERDEFGDGASHGKAITKAWRERLGEETEEEHPLVTENRRLRSLLQTNGIDYREEQT